MTSMIRRKKACELRGYAILRPCAQERTSFAPFLLPVFPGLRVHGRVLGDNVTTRSRVFQCVAAIPTAYCIGCHTVKKKD